MTQVSCAETDRPCGGKIKNFFHNWEKLTHDKFILSMVKGCKIDLSTHMPCQLHIPTTSVRGCHGEAMDVQIKEYLRRGIIIHCNHEEGEYISTVFLREKKCNSFRMILNLKEFNKFIPYLHFKMDSIHHCIRLMTPGCYMASIDLMDAYFSVPIHIDHQKYLKFIWRGVLYRFTCMPQGLSCAPRLFTKLMKPVFSVLRSKGHLSSGYLDDTFLLGDTWDKCSTNVSDTLQLFKELGLSPHLEKSVTNPTQVIEHLGFVLNSIEMTVGITEEKMSKLKTLAMTVLNQSNPTIREVASIVGFMVACFPGVEYAQLFYRQIEIEKSAALTLAKGNFEERMILSQSAIQEINWWVENALKCRKKIHHGKFETTISTDASLLGWGASMPNKTTGGRWSPTEATLHINVLELKAVLLGLQSLCKDKQDCHIKILCDNTTAVSYLRNMGGTHSRECNDIAKEIWLWCIARNIYLTAAQIPVVANHQVDKESSLFNDRTEWKLKTLIFNQIIQIFGKPDIDMFASRLNHQLNNYVSWLPDPEASGVDAFTMSWSEHYLYAFPPFSLIPQVLQKIEQDNAHMLMVVPLWTTQTWFPKLTRLLAQNPILLPQDPCLLSLPHQPEKFHPLGKDLTLMACHLSGQALLPEEFRSKLKTSSSRHGERELKNNMKYTFKSGYPFVVEDIVIPFYQL